MICISQSKCCTVKDCQPDAGNRLPVAPQKPEVAVCCSGVTFPFAYDIIFVMTDRMLNGRVGWAGAGSSVSSQCFRAQNPSGVP